MIIDDDIQYLGCSLSQRLPAHYTHRTVSGIALHVEKSDNNDPYTLVFTKDKSSTVHIGRRPGSEIESRGLEQDKGKALFRCAVVSRKHAKIAFSDSGNVYLIDLGSHHGTHVRKPGETSSRALEHEVPTPLSDGDIITFGKSVGRNEETVRPVVARLELRYSGPSSATPIKPLVVPDFSPTTTGNKSHSGRYGLHSPSSSSSSDDADSVDFDIYSDIEEIPPPAPAPPVPVSHQQQSQQGQQPESQSKTTESHLGRALEVLKRLLPPTSLPSVPQQQHNGAPSSSRLEEQSPIIHSVSPSPPALVSSSSDLPPFWSIQANHHSSPPPLSLLPRYPSISGIDLPDDFFIDLPPFNPVNPSFNHNEEEEDNNSNDNNDRERSESPMDLASPSPPPPDKEVIGDAWFDRSLSSSASELSSESSEPVATPKDDHLVEPENGGHSAAEEEGLLSSSSPPPPPPPPAQQQPEGSREAGDRGSAMNHHHDLGLLPLSSPYPIQVNEEKEQEQEREQEEEKAQGKAQEEEKGVVDSAKFVTIAQYEELKSKYTKLQADLENLQTQRRKYKTKFNANVHTVTSKFHEVEDKLIDMSAQYSLFTDQMEGVTCGDIPELQAQVDDLMDQKELERDDVEELRERIGGLDRRMDEVELECRSKEGEWDCRMGEMEKEGREVVKELKEEREDAQEYVDMLHGLTEDIGTLRTKTEQTVEAELSSLRELRASILEEVATLKSLKRKRSDDDVDGDDDDQGLDDSNSQVVPPLALAEDGTMSSDPCIDFRIQQQPLSSPDRPSRRKRARKFVSVVAQTATAVTMGAVVTWVALAFS